MTHTDAVNLLRTAPRTVRLVLGRVLELPQLTMLPHLLPDIIIMCKNEELGNGNLSVLQHDYLEQIKCCLLLLK